MQVLSKKYNSDIESVDFRGKEDGWGKNYLKVRFKNGKTYKKYYLYDKYYTLFSMEHISTREVCDVCPFRKRHVSDITIADFWGLINTQIPNDGKGISLVALLLLENS